jgi:hypothetical protein
MKVILLLPALRTTPAKFGEIPKHGKSRKINIKSDFCI